MSNFFSALDADSDDDKPKVAAKPTATKKKTSTLAEPSQAKDTRRDPHHEKDRNTSKAKREVTREGKRAYDRRSGTGRGKEIKKKGGGSHNWGNAQQDARRNEGAVVEEGEEYKEEAAAVEEVQDVKAEPEEPEVQTLSYEEYMKTKAKPDSELFKSVQEREVDNEFANVKPRVAVEEDFLVMGGKEKKKKGPKEKEKKTIDVGFRVADPNAPPAGGRGRGRDDRRDSGRGRAGARGEGRGSRGGGGRGEGRGSRGGGRGRGRDSDRGGRGRGRGGRGIGRSSQTDGINLTDSSAFPSL